MCFKNLPIEFDASGVARLKEGWANPYAFDAVAPRSFVRSGKASAIRSGVRRLNSNSRHT